MHKHSLVKYETTYSTVTGINAVQTHTRKFSTSRKTSIQLSAEKCLATFLFRFLWYTAKLLHKKR